MVLPPAILPLPGTALRVLSLLIPTTQKALRGAVGAIMMAFRPSHVLGQRHNANPFQSIYCASLARLSTRVFVLKERSMMATYSLFCLSLLPSTLFLIFLPQGLPMFLSSLYICLSHFKLLSLSLSLTLSLSSPLGLLPPRYLLPMFPCSLLPSLSSPLSSPHFHLPKSLPTLS